jgi:23S rRNA pseudouridine1911/1915/1917 synthase
MSVSAGGREARTRYRRLAAFRSHSHLALQLDTGRTHQIRVHMAHLSHPIVGDREYGGVRSTPAGMQEAAAQAVSGMTRQALHARRLQFHHPVTGEVLDLHSPLPHDMARLLDALALDAA